MNGFPLCERAGFGGHAEFCPGATAALAAAAGAVQRLRVPLIAGAAGGFALGEDFGWGGGEAAAGEAVRGVAEAGEHLGAAGEDFGLHVKMRLGGGTARYSRPLRSSPV